MCEEAHGQAHSDPQLDQDGERCAYLGWQQLTEMRVREFAAISSISSPTSICTATHISSSTVQHQRPGDQCARERQAPCTSYLPQREKFLTSRVAAPLQSFNTHCDTLQRWCRVQNKIHSWFKTRDVDEQIKAVLTNNEQLNILKVVRTKFANSSRTNTKKHKNVKLFLI